MKRILLVILSVIIALYLSGCREKTKEEEFNDIQKTLNSISTYTCKADITVKGNKSSKSFKAKHMFKNPNKYIAEIIEPKENEGNKTVYNGKQAYLYNKQINQHTILKDFEVSGEEMLFIGYFLKNLNTTEEVTIRNDKIDEKDYLTIEVDIPGNNKHRKYERLWVDKQTHVPYKLVVFDDKNNEVVNVIYKDVEYNVDIQDEKFTIK